MTSKNRDQTGTSKGSESRWYQGRGGLLLGLFLLLGAAVALYPQKAAEEPKELAAEKKPISEGLAPVDQRLLELKASATTILEIIAEQEASRDATCWSTVRMIEGFSLGRQLTPSAEVARIEVTRALLARLWSKASQGKTRPLSTTDIDAAMPEAVRNAVADMEIAQARSPGSAPAGEAAQGMTDQQRTTENWRAILSLILSETMSPLSLALLDQAARVRLAKASTAMTSLVLRQSAAAAEAAQHDRVALEDIQTGYEKLVRSWFPEGAGANASTRPDLKAGESSKELAVEPFSIVRESTMKNAAGKLLALSRYNKLKKAPSFSSAGQLAPYLSELVGFKISPEAAQKIAFELRSFARLFLAPEGPQRSDTFSDSTRGVDPHQGPRRHLTLAHVFNAGQDLFPTRKLPNADAEVLMMRNLVPAPGKPSVIDERRVSLTATSLDAIRDTGIHWLSVAQALEEEPHVALDPFAAEFLSENISEYGYFLLTGAVKGAVAMGLPEVSGEVIDRLPWKYPLGRFFPIEDPEGEDAMEDSKPAAPPPVTPRFSERPLPQSVSASAGAKCTEGRRGFQAFMGSGLGLGDYDGDGLTDIFVAADGCNRLLHNDGKYNFSDVTEAMGIVGLTSASRHPLFADVNGDDHLDLLVIQSDAPSKLFIREGTKFVDKTAKFGLTTGTGAHNAHFFDYDRDGDLDLFVGHYGPSKGDSAVPSLDGRNGYKNQLWRNENGARFTDVSEKSGVDSPTWTLASAAVDIDGDGYQDFWLANDFGRDEVFLNQGDGTFLDIAGDLGTDDRGAGMNVSVLDINGDARPDVFVSMIEMFSKTLRFTLPRGQTTYEIDDRVLSSSYYISGMKLFVSGAKPKKASTLPFAFSDGSRKHIDSQRKGWAWGATPFDYDKDGDLDLYLANGWIEKSAFFEQHNQLMVNQDGHLSSYGPPASPPPAGAATAPATPSPQTELSYLGSSRAVASANLSGAGKQDILVVDYRGGLRLFENTTQSRGTSLTVSLKGKGKNRFGVGASVELFTNEGPSMIRYASSGINYLAQDEGALFFGLAPGRRPNRLVITWPNGQKSTIENPVPSGEKITIEEP